MGYYDGNTVTALWNYAQHFAMSDNSYSTVRAIDRRRAQPDLGPDQRRRRTGTAPATRPTAATVADDDRRCRSDRRRLLLIDDQQVAMKGRNIGDLLNAADITWGWFEGGFDLTDDQRERHDRLRPQHVSPIINAVSPANVTKVD